MRGVTHLSGGLLVGSVLVRCTNPSGGVVLGAVLGALAPDADAPYSFLQHMVEKTFPKLEHKHPQLTPFFFALRALAFTVMAIVSAISSGKHRGVAHSPLIPILLGLAGLCLPELRWGLWSVALGWLSHLLLDAMTPAGIWKVHGPIRTGSSGDWGIGATLLALAILILVI